MSLVTETPGILLVTTEYYNDHLYSSGNYTAEQSDDSYEGYNASNDNMDNRFNQKPWITKQFVFLSIISSIEIPIICLAIYAVFSLSKSKQAAPVFVINLLISDSLQIVSSLLLNLRLLELHFIIVNSVYWAAVTNLYFMTCIAVERYILIAHPVWHRSHHSVTCLVCTSLTGWLLPFIVIPVCNLINALIFILPLIPYPVVILCFIGACRSLSHSISLTPLKKQLVLATLFFVVISYTILILPLVIIIIQYVQQKHPPNNIANYISLLYVLNPLMDCLLYVFMRSDAENIIRTPHCCSRLKRVRTEMGQTTNTDIQSDHV